MANEQTSVPLFVADTILTAAQQNISAATGVPVFATTVTRDAAFGGANKALAEGQLCYLSATDVVQYYDGAAWATVGPAAAATSGLTLISATAMTTGSVSVNNCFTSTYDNYRLLFSPSATTADATITLRLRLSGTDSSVTYTSSRLYGFQAAAASSANQSGVDEMLLGYVKTAVPEVTSISADIFSPAQARSTSAFVTCAFMENATVTNGFVMVTQNAHTPGTAYDGFTMLASAGNVTGTIYLYGYAKA